MKIRPALPARLERWKGITMNATDHCETPCCRGERGTRGISSGLELKESSSRSALACWRSSLDAAWDGTPSSDHGVVATYVM